LSEEFNDCFTITEIELWKVIGDLPEGNFGNQSEFLDDKSERWRAY
jgi:hypothetical protein